MDIWLTSNLGIFMNNAAKNKLICVFRCMYVCIDFWCVCVCVYLRVGLLGHRV